MTTLTLLNEIPTGNIELQYYTTCKLPEKDGILRWNFTRTTSDSSTELFNKYECTGHQEVYFESAIVVRRWMILITSGDCLEGFKKYCSDDFSGLNEDSKSSKSKSSKNIDDICRSFLCNSVLKYPPRYGLIQVPPKELISKCYGIDDEHLDIITCNYLPLEPFIKANNIGRHGKADIHQWIKKYATSTVRAEKLDLGHIRLVDRTVNLVHFVRGAEPANILDLVNRAFQSASYYFHNAPWTQMLIRDMIAKEPEAAGVGEVGEVGVGEIRSYIGYMLVILTNKYRPEDSKISIAKLLSTYSRLLLMSLCQYLRELSMPLCIQFAQSD